MLSAFCNFFAVATTRFNDSGFTSGLAFWLPPFFFCNFLLLLVGALPTMLLEGCLCGYFVASSQTAPVTMGVCCLLALAAVFFHDVWAWMPQLGPLGGAGTSEPRPASAVLLPFQRFRLRAAVRVAEEGFDSSYQRAGLLPTAFAVPFVILGRSPKASGL